MQTSPSLVNYPDLGEKVYDYAKAQILAGELAPGSQLLLGRLADRLGVSMTPVRDALNRLMAEGLVDDMPRKGYFVAKLDVHDIADQLRARLTIEVGAVDQGLASVQPEQLSAMRRLLVAMEQLLDEHGLHTNYPAFAEMDSEFHRLIISTAGSHHLVEMYRRLATHMHLHRLSVAVKRVDRRGLPTLAEHRAILAACEAGDLPALKAALVRHVEMAIQATLRSAQALT